MSDPVSPPHSLRARLGAIGVPVLPAIWTSVLAGSVLSMVVPPPANGQLALWMVLASMLWGFSVPQLLRSENQPPPVGAMVLGATHAVFLMGGAFLSGELNDAAYLGGAAVCAHVAGLTFAARGGPVAAAVAGCVVAAGVAGYLIYNPLFWNVPALAFLGLYGLWVLWCAGLAAKGVGGARRTEAAMTAGIALLGAALIASVGATVLAVFGIVGFALSVLLHWLMPRT